MRKLFLFLLLIPTLCFGDSESTIGGKTGTDHIIQDEGTSLRPRPYLNFTGSGISCSDTGGKTVCNASGGGSFSSVTAQDDGVGIGTFTTLNLGNNISGSISNNVLTATGSAGGSSQWQSTTNVGIGTYDNVGIGTYLPQASLDVTGVPADFGINLNGIPVNGGIDSFAVAVLHNDGANGSNTFTDSASVPNTFTANGGAIISTAQSVFGGASGLMVSATNSNITAPDSANWYFANNNFTIDLRIRFVSLAGNGDIVSQYQDGNNFWSFLYRTDVGRLIFQDLSGGVVKADMYTPWSPSINTWYHIAIVRSGNTGLIFIDDVSQAVTTGTAFSVDLGNNTGSLAIGGFTSATGYGYSDAYLDEVRISNGIARWTSTFTLPTSAYSATVTQPRIKFFDSGTTKFTFGYDGADASKLKIGTSDITTNTRLTIDSAGNVGIGTTAPPTTLYVKGTTRTEALQLSLNPVSGYVLTSNSLGVGTWAPASGGVAGTSQWITSNVGIGTYSNVGIGTTLPDSKLTVVSQSTVQAPVSNTLLHISGTDATDPRLLIDGYNGSTAVGPSYFGRRSRGTAASPSAIASEDTLLLVGGYGYGSTGYSSVNRVSQSMNAAEDWTDSKQGTYQLWNTTNTGTASSSEKMRLTANGNIGIGTITPQSRLDVSGSDSGTTITSTSDSMVAVSNRNTTSNNFSDLAFCTTTSTGGQVCTSKIAGIHVSHTNGLPSGSLAFVTQNSGLGVERMRIDSTGNVGIGTTFLSGGSSGGALIVMNGNVGIGTWKPTSQLNLSGNLVASGGSFGGSLATTGNATATFSATARTSNGTAAAPSWTFTNDTDNGLYFVSSNYIGISTNGTPRMIFENANIGIGTVQSTNALSIQPGIAIGNASTSSYLRTTAPSGGIIVEGNIGLGTTIPASKLTIGTSTLMQKVTATNTACSTTCGQMGCYFGEDTVVLGTLLDCSDATADVCMCSK